MATKRVALMSPAGHERQRAVWRAERARRYAEDPEGFRRRAREKYAEDPERHRARLRDLRRRRSTETTVR